MDPLKIGVYLADQNPGRDRSLGITRMTECLLHSMAQGEELELSQLCSRSSFQLDGIVAQTEQVPWKTDGRLGRILSDQTHPLFSAKLGEQDVWFYPKGYLPWLVPAKRPNVIMVHDTILQWYADYYPKHRALLDYEYWCRMMRHSIRNADHILAVSETTALQIQELCERFHIRAPKITVTYEGSVFETEEPAEPSQKGDFVLHLASSAPHKKTNLLLEWWGELHLSGVKLPPLKLVGNVDEEGAALVAACLGIHMSPRLDEMQFRKVMKEARSLILPSEVEGFGLPALEAYYCGTPVCYVEGTSVHEILNGATNVGGFKLSSRHSFFEALESTLSLPHSEVLASRSRLLEKFSIQAFAKSVVHSLQEVKRAQCSN